ncbi:ubiquitin carboxyl-terminal hydrolase 40 [Trichonephila clavipes]|nr:ubiquitin carboxyl-terminal hydrolase 40 [Trichonephila clavipes]
MARCSSRVKLRRGFINVIEDERENAKIKYCAAWYPHDKCRMKFVKNTKFLHYIFFVVAQNLESLKDLGILEGTKIFVWDGKQLGGEHFAIGVAHEPVLLNISVTLQNGETIEMSRGFPKTTTISELKVLISNLVPLPLEDIRFSRLDLQGEETRLSPLNENHEFCTLSELSFIDGDNIVAESIKCDDIYRKEISNKISLVVQNCCQNFTSESNGSHLVELTVELDNSVEQLRNLIVSKFNLDSNRSFILRKYIKSQSKRPPLHEHYTIREAGLVEASCLTIEEGEPPAPDQPFTNIIEKNAAILFNRLPNNSFWRDYDSDGGRNLKTQKGFIQCVPLETINTRFPPEEWLHIYTDGSLLDFAQGAGIGVFSHPFSFYLHAGPLTTHFDDSTSALQALSNYNENNCLRVQNCRELLGKIKGKIVFQWVPSHCGLWGNERADFLAKKGTGILQNFRRDLTLHSAKLEIKRIFRESFRLTASCVARDKPWSTLCKKSHGIPSSPRAAAVAKFRLLTGHDRLCAHLFRFNLVTSPICVLCDTGQDMTAAHLDECSALNDLNCIVKRGIFGPGSLMVKVMNLWLACHEFEPSTAKDLPYREALHIKSV